MDQPASPRQLIVVGSSAGGIQALSTLVATLPVDFPVPLIIAQHLHPAHTSHLAEILQRQSALPVQTVTDHHELGGGVIFVVPPNRHVEITDNDVRLVAGAGVRPMPSIDHLFSSAAAVFGPGLIAVVLTGTGSDGAAGARDVKLAGGTVIIEAPETSSFPGMALALAPTTVDIIANLEDIGPILSELVNRADPDSLIASERELDELLDRLRERNGVDFTNYKRGTILRRLQRRLVATGAADIDAYTTYLDSEPEEYERLISSFLIPVTEFFRDPDLFAHFLGGGLADVVERARERGELRIWSAGCATGEEAFSMAIVVSELLGDDLKRVSVRIFGTDLNAQAVAFARRGVYPPGALKNLSPQLVERYFVAEHDVFEVTQAIRSMAVFGQHDLGQRSPFPRIDLALCRNVLIYFTPELQRRALQLFAFALQDGGLLVLGKTESVRPLSEYFVEEKARLKIFRRIGSHILIPPAQVRAMMPEHAAEAAAIRPQPRMSQAGGLARRPNQEFSSGSSVSRQFDTMLNHLVDGIVVVDRSYSIQVINVVARRHLGIRRPALDHDLIHLIQQLPLNAVRDAIDAAFDGATSTQTYRLTGAAADAGESRDLEVHFAPLSDEQLPDPIDRVVIRTADVSQLARLRNELDEATSQRQQLSNEFHRLELANEDLAVTNASLRSANEELQISNEEFQAAAEEVETLNEELQATNEELETLNEELQATIEELNAANEDLDARSRALEEAVLHSEQQRQQSDDARARLEAVLAGMSSADAVVVIDEDGEFVLASPAFIDTFGESGEFLQAQAEDGTPLALDQTPQQRAARGESFTMRLYMTGQDGKRRALEATGHSIGANQRQGGVIVVHTLTDR